MFLIDRPTRSPGFGSPGLRAELAPRQLFGSTGDLVRDALMARPSAPSPAAPSSRRPASQLDLALPAPARRRRAG